MHSRYFYKKIAGGILFASLALFSVQAAVAKEAGDAFLFLSPPSGVYTVGETFTIDIKINTGGKTINAAEGVMGFNTNDLEVISLDAQDSIFSMWPIEEPSFSNEEGIIRFEGAVLEGYKGESGTVLSVVFRALRNNTSSVRFENGAAVLAADGQGSNILARMGSGSYTFNSEEVASQIEYVAVPQTPTSTEIVSSTHPDGERWYTDKTASFSWTNTDDVDAVRTLMSRRDNAIPTVYYDNPITEKTIDGLEDGTWYFYLQKHNAHGWGKVARYQLNIDNETPGNLVVNEILRQDKTDPNVLFGIEANDYISGIDHFEITIDGDGVQTWKDDGTHVYSPDNLTPGSHTLSVSALDKAGNNIQKTVNFNIEYLATPVFTGVPSELVSSSILVVKGVTLPDSRATVWLSKGADTITRHTVLSDNEGVFTFVSEEKVQPGDYQVWAQVMDERGAQSMTSEKAAIVVNPPGFVVFGTWAISFLSVIVPLAGLAILLVVFVWYGRYKSRTFKRKLQRETIEAENTLHHSFTKLREDMREYVTMLDEAKQKRKLTHEEEKLRHLLKRDLFHTAERVVAEEIEDIKEMNVLIPKRVKVQKLN